MIFKHFKICKHNSSNNSYTKINNISTNVNNNNNYNYKNKNNVPAHPSEVKGDDEEHKVKIVKREQKKKELIFTQLTLLT